MEQIAIEPIRPSEIIVASEVLSAAFTTNPLVVSVFRAKSGDALLRRLIAVHNVILRRFPGEVLVAKRQDDIVGVMRYVKSPSCQLSPLKTLPLLPSMLMAFRGSMPRAMSWMSGWKLHDPGESHWHLGPVGVRPDMQGQGIGSRMLSHFCEHVDGLGEGAYLETDKPENVRLYQRFGFSTTEQEPILGVNNWFMWRPPAQTSL